MKNPLTWLSRRRFPYQPLIAVKISREALLHNLAQFAKLAPNGIIAPVLKSNAYGHGLLEIAEILERFRIEARRTQNVSTTIIPFFIVDSYFEAVALRARGIRTPLLVIGYTRPETIAASRLKEVSFTVTSIDTLKSLAKISARRSSSTLLSLFSLLLSPYSLLFTHYSLHIKIDTGMHRQGILPEEVAEAISILKNNRRLSAKGICSHLSDADNPDPTFTKKQIHMWNSLVLDFKTNFPSLQFIHLSATDGHTFANEIKANVSRLGIGLYGLSENESLNSRLQLKPVLSMSTILTSIKSLKRGEAVGYDNTFVADRDMVITTIPVGYFEGLDRRLSSGPDGKACSFVQVGPEMKSCPIIGRISMNISTIDVSSVPKAKTGMSVTVISADPAAPNSIRNIARSCDLITYEFVVKIPGHLRRVVE